MTWHIGVGDPPRVVPTPTKRFRSPKLREWTFDPDAMISEITGAEFVELGYTNRSLLVYTRGNEIFYMSAYKEKGGGNLLQAVFE